MVDLADTDFSKNGPYSKALEIKYDDFFIKTNINILNFKGFTFINSESVDFVLFSRFLLKYRSFRFKLPEMRFVGDL